MAVVVKKSDEQILLKKIQKDLSKFINDNDNDSENDKCFELFRYFLYGNNLRSINPDLKTLLEKSDINFPCDKITYYNELLPLAFAIYGKDAEAIKVFFEREVVFFKKIEEIEIDNECFSVEGKEFKWSKNLESLSSLDDLISCTLELLKSILIKRKDELDNLGVEIDDISEQGVISEKGVFADLLERYRFHRESHYGEFRLLSLALLELGFDSAINEKCKPSWRLLNIALEVRAENKVKKFLEKNDFPVDESNSYVKRILDYVEKLNPEDRQIVLRTFIANIDYNDLKEAIAYRENLKNECFGSEENKKYQYGRTIWDLFIRNGSYQIFMRDTLYTIRESEETIKAIIEHNLIFDKNACVITRWNKNIQEITSLEKFISLESVSIVGYFRRAKIIMNAALKKDLAKYYPSFILYYLYKNYSLDRLDKYILAKENNELATSRALVEFYLGVLFDSNNKLEVTEVVFLIMQKLRDVVLPVLSQLEPSHKNYAIEALSKFKDQDKAVFINALKSKSNSNVQLNKLVVERTNLGCTKYNLFIDGAPISQSPFVLLNADNGKPNLDADAYLKLATPKINDMEKLWKQLSSETSIKEWHKVLEKNLELGFMVSSFKLGKVKSFNEKIIAKTIFRICFNILRVIRKDNHLRTQVIEAAIRKVFGINPHAVISAPKEKHVQSSKGKIFTVERIESYKIYEKLGISNQELFNLDLPYHKGFFLSVKKGDHPHYLYSGINPGYMLLVNADPIFYKKPICLAVMESVLGENKFSTFRIDMEEYLRKLEEKANEESDRILSIAKQGTYEELRQEIVNNPLVVELKDETGKALWDCYFDSNEKYICSDREKYRQDLTRAVFEYDLSEGVNDNHIYPRNLKDYDQVKSTLSRYCFKYSIFLDLMLFDNIGFNDIEKIFKLQPEISMYLLFVKYNALARDYYDKIVYRDLINGLLKSLLFSSEYIFSENIFIIMLRFQNNILPMLSKLNEEQKQLAYKSLSNFGDRAEPFLRLLREPPLTSSIFRGIASLFWTEKPKSAYIEVALREEFKGQQGKSEDYELLLKLIVRYNIHPVGKGYNLFTELFDRKDLGDIWQRLLNITSYQHKEMPNKFADFSSTLVNGNLALAFTFLLQILRDKGQEQLGEIQRSLFNAWFRICFLNIVGKFYENGRVLEVPEIIILAINEIFKRQQDLSQEYEEKIDESCSKGCGHNKLPIKIKRVYTGLEDDVPAASSDSDGLIKRLTDFKDKEGRNTFHYMALSCQSKPLVKAFDSYPEIIDLEDKEGNTIWDYLSFPKFNNEEFSGGFVAVAPAAAGGPKL